MKVESLPIKKSRGHIDRYNGLSEEEVIQRTLPDYLKENLDLIVVMNLEISLNAFISNGLFHN